MLLSFLKGMVNLFLAMRMNKTELRERVVRRLYGDAWRDNWKTIPEALEIAMYKDEWKKTVAPIEFNEVTAKHWLLREWHNWFAKNNVSRLDYEIFATTEDRALGVPSEHKAQVWILDETVRALFKLTYFKG